MRLVRPRDAAARHREPVHALGQEAAQWDVVGLTGGQLPQERPLALRVLEARHVFAKKGRDLPHLAARPPLRLGEVPHARAEHSRDPRAVHGEISLVRRAEEEDVLPGQRQLPRRARLAHQFPQTVHAAPLVGVGLAIRREGHPLELDHAKHQGHGLHEVLAGPADLEGAPAKAATSPSPVQSSSARAITTIGPDLVSKTTPSSRGIPTTPVARACSSTRTLA